MDNDRINLLPPERQRVVSREYLVRLGVVVSVLITALTAIAGLLLLPTFILLMQSTAAKEAQLANLKTVLSSADEKVLSAHLSALSRDAATLVALGGNPFASEVMRTTLAVSRPGVTLSSFVYTPVAAKLPGKLAISGVAATRDALRTYQLALQGTSFVTTADLPVSAYAKDSNIDFTITMTLAP